MKILLIEDEPGIARLIRRGLEEAGYRVEATANGRQGLEMAGEKNYNLILLDLMVPGHGRLAGLRGAAGAGQPDPDPDADGAGRGARTGCGAWTWARTTTCPSRSSSPSCWRASGRCCGATGSTGARVIQVADLVIDTGQRRVTRAGVEIGLSHREYELLEALAAHESQVLTREVIQERIWMDEDSYSNTVDVYIGMLRKKIDAGHPRKLIQTVRGLGYTLRVPETDRRRRTRP